MSKIAAPISGNKNIAQAIYFAFPYTGCGIQGFLHATNYCNSLQHLFSGFPHRRIYIVCIDVGHVGWRIHVCFSNKYCLSMIG